MQVTVLHGGGRRASRREKTYLTFMLCDFVNTIRIAYANGFYREYLSKQSLKVAANNLLLDWETSESTSDCLTRWRPPR